MNGNGYNAMDKVLPSAFSGEQRTRLEALTAARALRDRGNQDVADWLVLADFIVRGATPEISFSNTYDR